MWSDFLAENARRFPDRIALVLAEDNRRLTYGQLNNEAARWAAWFQSQGLKHGDRVAMLAVNRLEHLTQFFGCAKLGLTFVPLNFRLSAMELEEQLRRLTPALLLGEGPCALKQDAPYMDMDALDLPAHNRYTPAEVGMRDTLMMLFTSGSSGVPKGVMLHAGMLLWNCINTQGDWDLRSNDVGVVHMPFFHTGGYNVTCLPLLRIGGRLIMTRKFDAGLMLDLIDREQITFFFAVPTMYRMMSEHPKFHQTSFASVRFIISGGAACPANLIAAYRQKGLPLKQGFGLTEVGPNCFTMTDEEARKRGDSVGRAMMHSRVKLADADGNPVPTGEIGELCLRGPHVCKGYWQMPETFARVFRDGWFHTGDLMRCDADGFYYVVGRHKDMYISGGENVFPGEVVRQLVQHPGVNEALVVAVPSIQWGEVGFAFIQGDPSLDLTALRAFLNDRLSRYKHPHFLKHMDSFPLLANNKLDIQKMKSMALDEGRAAAP